MSARYQVLTVEWVGSVAWSAVFGSLSYIAMSQESITLGGRSGVSHCEGLSAVVTGLGLLAFALAPVWLLLRVHPFRRLLRLLLCLAWLGGSIIYLVFFYR